MKIEATVEGAAENGDTLELTLKGWPTTAPEGTYATDYEIKVPANARSKKAFHIGRRVNITIEPV